MTSKRVIFYIGSDDFALLTEIAGSRGQTVSELVRQAVHEEYIQEDGLAREEPTATKE